MKYFGTDGIRGKANEFITPNMSYMLGKSMALFKDKTDKIIISRDTRVSGEMIVNNIKKGALEAGIDVCDIGVYATPILANASINHNCIGIMVTASHNPYYDNGIKIFNQGQKSLPDEEAIIENVIDNNIDLSGVTPGKEIVIPSILDEYFQLFSKFSDYKNLHIGLDLANGATVNSALKVLPEFVENYMLLGAWPDGENINQDCGSTHLKNLQNLVYDYNLDLGIAFDGDGDRILCIDDEGEIIDGDLLIYIFAKYLKEEFMLNNDTVVLSKMSNLGIIKALKALGIEVVQTEVGDKYIFQALEEKNAILGGENSGHVINKTLLKTGDGVLNAWFLLKILDHYQVRLSDLKKEVTYYPDKLINIENIDKNIAKDEEIVALVENYRKILGNDGKVLVRASGTEPLLRVSVSAKTEDLVDMIIDDIVDKIKSKGKGE